QRQLDKDRGVMPATVAKAIDVLRHGYAFVLIRYDSQYIDRFSYGRRHDTSVFVELTLQVSLTCTTCISIVRQLHMLNVTYVIRTKTWVVVLQQGAIVVDYWQRLTSYRFDRRAALRTGALGTGAAAFLAACGGGGNKKVEDVAKLLAEPQ